jgi:hypothetical protein
MRHVILIPLLLVCIAYSLAKWDEKNNSEEVSNFVADSKASIFRMTWHPGGAEKQENIPVAPSCFRVHHIETQPTPPKELKNP